MSREMRLREGHARMEAGDLEGAESCFAEILRGDPSEPNACNLLGLLRKRQGRLEEAEALHRAAIEGFPEAGGFHNNLANLLNFTGRLEEAEYAYREAIRREPGFPDPYLNLGRLLLERGRVADAYAIAEEGTKAAPGDGELWSLKGQVLSLGCRGERSLACHRRALDLAPDRVRAWDAYARSLLSLGQPEEAVRAFQRCRDLDPSEGRPLQGSLLAHQYAGDLSPEGLAGLHQEWAERFLPAAPEPAWTLDRDPERPLNLGYLSPDFRTHSVMMFLEAMLEHHDRRRFRLHAYDVSPLPSDAVTARVKERVDVWRKMDASGAAGIAAQMRQDRLDILVDLGGHTHGGRLDVVAARGAPVQVFWLGYPGTTGVKAFTARFTDSVVDPPGEESLSAESPVRLPQGFHAFTPDPRAPEVGPLPALERGYVTFGSFNSLPKHTPALLKTWARLLRRVPGSRLVIKAAGLEDAHPRSRIAELFEEEGVAPSRVELLGRLEAPEEHLALYRRLDLALDTFPYCGVTTTCQALWMGVPVVTLQGPWAASRYGASLLRQAGLPEFIAQDADEYLRIAEAWTWDLEGLSALRQGMRARLLVSDLLDGAGLCRRVEAACRTLWGDWCRKDQLMT